MVDKLCWAEVVHDQIGEVVIWRIIEFIISEVWKLDVQFVMYAIYRLGSLYS